LFYVRCNTQESVPCLIKGRQDKTKTQLVAVNVPGFTVAGFRVLRTDKIVQELVQLRVENTAGTGRGARSRTARTREQILLLPEAVRLEKKLRLRDRASRAQSRLPICNLIQVFCGVDSEVVGDVDEYLMKLAMGNATGWPEDSAPGAGAMPRPVKVGKMLEQAE
jgi:hypothetical protein